MRTKINFHKEEGFPTPFIPQHAGKLCIYMDLYSNCLEKVRYPAQPSHKPKGLNDMNPH
jgi:hypothetical protein